MYTLKFFIIDYKNTLRCYKIKDGSECWNLQTEDSFTISNAKYSLILIDEMVVFSNSIGDITAVDIETGLITWQLPTQSSSIINETYNFKISKLVSDGNSIFFSNNKNEFFSIDARNGLIRWIQSVNSSLRPTIIDSLIFTISNEGYLFIIDDRTGNILRITDILTNFKNRENIKPIGFIHGRHKIFVSLNNGQIISLNSTTGEQQKITKVHGSKVSRPYIFKNSMYLIKDNAVSKINWCF